MNDTHVGEIEVQGNTDAWTYGQFHPTPAFSAFAPLFGAWSLLIHADGGTEHLSPAASQELRQAETDLDCLRAVVVERANHRRHSIGQLNIDGPLIEFRQF